MIGILAGLSIMVPFSVFKCKMLLNSSPEYSTLVYDDINKQKLDSKEAYIFFDSTMWDKHKLVIVSLIISVLFTIANILLLVFVKERTG